MKIPRKLVGFFVFLKILCIIIYMELENKIQADLVSAMKNKQENTVAALRSVKAAIQNEKVNGVYHELTDNDIVKLIQKLVKQRQESIEIYTQAGRHELADKEQQEMFVLMNYLPKSLSEEELHSAIDDIVAELGASSMKDMGNVMKLLRERYAGQYDGKTASEYIKEKLF
jgi:uncharacterized protein YqeY